MKDRIGQDPANVTEHRPVAENHLIPTGNLLFAQVIILIHVFFLLIQYFLPKNHTQIDWNYSNLCWEHYIISTETIYIFKEVETFLFPHFKKKIVVWRVNMDLVSFKEKQTLKP